MKKKEYELGTSSEFQKEMTEEEFLLFLKFTNKDHAVDKIPEQCFFKYEPKLKKMNAK